MRLSPAEIDEIRVAVRDEIQAAWENCVSEVKALYKRPPNSGPVEYFVTPPRVDRGGFIYFVGCRCDGDPIKIGYATDLGSRMSTLRNACPFEVDLIGWYWCEDYRKEEAELHERFAMSRIRGEWFARTVELERLVSCVREARRARLANIVAHPPAPFEWRGVVREWGEPR